MSDRRPPELPAELDLLLHEAVDRGASDIHLDSGVDRPAVRFRVDGEVRPHRSLSSDNAARRLINQARVAAALDIDAMWVPEHGQFQWSDETGEESRDVRLTVVPTAPRNLALHLRLLKPPQHMQALDELGLGEAGVASIRDVLGLPHGLVLISGPTGAGKTTTLYAMLTAGAFDDLVVGTVEDPAELDLPAIRQVEVDERHGLTMAEGLRALLRMDPDVIAVGEIRDRASAATTAQAALAGRLALATVHARDAASAITALHQLGVPYYVLGHALRLVMNQQVVRRLCESCAKPRQPDEPERELFRRYGVETPEHVHDPVGCELCNDRAYRGRIGVFEVVPIDDELGRWLTQGRPPTAIRQRLEKSGVRPFVADALRKAAAGATSLPEINRFFPDSGLEANAIMRG